MNNPLISIVALLVVQLTFTVAHSSAAISTISPAQLRELIEDTDSSRHPIVLDTRGGYKDYFRGHLPLAHHINFDTLRGTDKGVPVQYLPDPITEELLVRAGVQKGRTHVVYATGDVLPNDEILSASMVAFVLEKFGIEDIRVLDGGFKAYKEAGFPVTQEYFGNPAGSLPERRQRDIAVTVATVLSKKKEPGVLLVDARPKIEYVGEDDVWLRKGHIPGAISFHWARLMDKENTHRFKPFEETRSELEEAGVTPDKEIIVYCGTSREGSLLRFYLKYVAGYPNVRLYEGSWKEYANLKDLPAEAGEPKKSK